jgi:diguanylate cyclase (GGDEF)-like protein
MVQLQRRASARPTLSSLFGDDKQSFWPYAWRLRYLAALVVAVALTIEAEPDDRLLTFTLPLIGVVLAIPFQHLSRRTDRWGVAVLATDCAGLGIAALLFPQYYALAVAVLIGSLALLGAAAGRTGIRIGFGVSLPTLIAAVVFRSPPSGVALVLVVLLSYSGLTKIALNRDQSLNRASDNFDELLNSMDIAVWIADLAADEPHTIVGELGKPVGRHNDFYHQPGAWFNAVHPDDRHRIRSADLASHDGHAHVTRYRELHTDGTYRWLEDNIYPIVDDKGQLTSTRGFRRDVTDLVQSQAVAEQFTHFVNALDDGVILARHELNGTITLVACNQAARDLVPESIEHLIGKPFKGFFLTMFAGTSAEAEFMSVRAMVIERRSGSELVELSPPGQESRRINVSVRPLSADTVAVVLTDVTAEFNAQQQLARRATTDQLTGLLNRVEFHDRLRAALHDRADESVTIVLLDLDQFKQVNDSFGHSRGDQLLVAVSRRISSELPNGACLARLGGDEFAVLMASGHTAADGVAFAHRLAQSFSEGIVLDDLTLHVGASMGIASAPDHADSLETLIAHADVAMYLAKSRGGGHAIYDPELDTSSARSVLLLGDLRRALAVGEIICHFQPVSDKHGNLVNAEALVRWMHPDLGLIMPGEFIDLTELSSLSEPLAMTVLRNALHQYELMRSVGINIGLSINLSPGNLLNLSFVDELCRVVTAAGIPDGTLTVEITERTVLDRLKVMMPTLHRLRSLGIRLALDDFGGGQTSLALLRRLPLDELKIDKMLIDDVARGSDVIVRSIIELSHNLGFEVVAEGVESALVQERLIRLGCDRIQGYHVSRPLPGAMLMQLLRVHADGAQS